MSHRLPLNSLNTFYFAAEKSSFQAAAEALYVTPSAVSHQIRSLEKLLGYKLFERLDKAVKLTTKGERLYLDIAIPMKQLHDASRKALHGERGNTLAISVAPIFATGWLIPRIKDFHISHPDINLSVIASFELVDFLADPFDAAIRMGKLERETKNSFRLFSSEIVPVCRPTLLASRERLFEPEELLKLHLIQNSALPTLWKDWLRAANVQAGVSPKMMYEVPSSAQVVEAIQSADSIGLIDRNFIQKDLESGRLSIASDFVLHSKGDYFLTAPDRVIGLPAFEAFKNWLYVQLEAFKNKKPLNNGRQ